MSNKLIFLDIDGTLTGFGQSTPPESAVLAIHQAQAKGHKVLICSGRSLSMLHVFEQYRFDGVVASAGGYLTMDGKVLFDCPMTPALQQKTVAAFQKQGITYILECLDGSYLFGILSEFLSPLADGNVDNSELMRIQEEAKSSLNLHSGDAYNGEPCYKISFLAKNERQVEELRRELEDDFVFCIHGKRGGCINGEIINRAFNKGTGVKRIADALGVPLADTVGFGDSMNDWEMMQTVGLSICMGNGSDELKQISDEVCGRVDEDGLYYAFKAHGWAD